MKLGLILAALAAVSFSSPAHALYTGCSVCYDVDDIANSVVCQVKDVTVLAKSGADCTTLGGEVAKK